MIPRGKEDLQRSFLGLSVLFAAGVWLAWSNRSPDADYAVAAYASATRLTILVGPLLSMWSAIRVGSRVTYLRQRRPLRPLLVVWLDALWIPVLAGPLAAAAALLVTTRTVAVDRPSLEVLGVTLAVLVGAAVLGAGMGVALPQLVAVPLVGALVYAWLALPTSGGNLTLRHVNGSFATCCTLDQQPSAAMLVASSVFALLVVLGVGLGVTTGLSRRRALTGAVGGLVGALLVSSAVLHRIEPRPGFVATSARSTQLVCARASGASICGWPEHRSLLRHALPELSVAVRRLEAAGVEGLAPHFSERADVGVMAVQLDEEATRTNRLISLVLPILPDPQQCGRRPADFDVYGALERATAWLARTAGVSRADLETQLDPAAVMGAEDIVKKSAGDQTQWFRTVLARLHIACHG